MLEHGPTLIYTCDFLSAFLGPVEHCSLKRHFSASDSSSLVAGNVKEQIVGNAFPLNTEKKKEKKEY